ncbi:response regulator [Microbacterium jejuense]|uniref:Response regulator n=1 Tax=Microbacterium jejuense TaxID=1263637 RepID=A0ABS7HSG1_9MICO|nr:response regulator [Microbacterium jejuense]MBW9094974.1 response regulator [Microbacterium jejuense]
MGRQRRLGGGVQNHWWVILGGVLATVLGCALAALLPVVRATPDWSAAIQLTMFMLAAIALSSIIGFIFGVPRTRLTVTEAEEGAIRPGAAQRVRYGRFEANSNLEQISDWLTKVLVGAGLAQLALVPAYIKQVGEYLDSSLQLPGGPPVAVAFVLYGVGVGFIFSYLWARLRLRVLLEESERIADSAAMVAADVEGLLQDAQIGAAAPGSPQEIEKTAAEAGRLAERDGVVGTVLWVDDHPINNRSLVSALRRIGARVVEVRSTAEALGSLDKRAYDLIVTDAGRTEDGAHVPDAGLRLLRELAQRRIASPVLVYTTRQNADAPQPFLDAGASLVTASPTELFAAALRLLG